MVRLLPFLLAVLAVVTWIAPSATAHGRDGIALHGVIVRVDAEHQAFILHTRSGRDVPVKVSDRTHIRVDGERATFDDLAPGQRSRVLGVPGARHVFHARIVSAHNRDDG